MTSEAKCFHDLCGRDQDLVESLFDITCVAHNLLAEGKIEAPDSRDLMRVCANLALEFVAEETEWSDAMSAAMRTLRAIEIPDIHFWGGKASSAVLKCHDILCDITDDFRSEYMLRVEQFAYPRLLKACGVEE